MHHAARPSVRLRAIALAAATAAVPVLAPPARAAGDDDLAPRLDRLLAQLEEQRERLHVPAASIAIVMNDEVVLARGLGHRDLERSLVATEDTVYAIGSVTKSFTAALVASLADDGLMDWDDPVRHHLPEFALADPAADEQVVIRDLLCHRTGLLGMDLLWYAGRATWEDMLPCVARAEPESGFRETFHYNNVMYLAAGEAAGRAGGTTWRTLMHERLLEPLGMRGTGASLATLPDRDRLAIGYRWDDETGSFEVVPYRATENIAPAGSIHSSAREMAQWVRFQLNRGAVDGRRVVGDARFDEMWKTHIAMGANGYGLGWIVGDIDGHRYLQHGGGIDGFTSTVGLLPDDGVGWVMLTNASGAPLPSLVGRLVFDALVAEPTEAVDAPLDLTAVEPYLGEYWFDVHGTSWEVLVRNGRLAVDVPNQMVFELNPADAEGRWTFRGFEQIAVEFDAPDASGAVNTIYLHQGGLRFELMRSGVEIAPEIPLSTLQRYLGRYESDGAIGSVEVLVQNNRLAVDVPGQMVYELHPPNEEGAWVFRVTPTIVVTFETEGDRVTALTMTESGVVTTFTAVASVAEGEAERPLPTPESMMATVHATWGREAYTRILNLRMTGTVSFVNQGIVGEVEMLAAGYDRFYQRLDFEPFGWAQTAFFGPDAASDSAFEPFATLEGAMRRQAQLQHPATMMDVWPVRFETVETVRRELRDDREVIVMRFVPEDLPPALMFFDAGDGRLLRTEGAIRVEGSPDLPITATYDDYRVVNGVRLPFRSVGEHPVNGRIVVQFDECEANFELKGEPWFMTPPGSAD
jgi:CubicO group peptidase (beta-lactamase class C family)